MRNSWFVQILVIAICVFCRSASADELFRYNYIEAGFQSGTDDMKGFTSNSNFLPFGNGADVSQKAIFGSYAVHELVAIGVQYSKATVSFDGSFSGTPVSFTATGSNLAIGVTLHKLISESTEMGLDLARGHTNVDAGTMTVAGTVYAVPASTDSSNSFGVRVRTAPEPSVRFLASAGRSTGGSSAASTDYSIGVEHELGKDFSVGAGYGLSTSSTDLIRVFSISGRYYY